MKHLILVGGGHAHVHILKQLQQHQWLDTRITLISPDPYQYYSGMFSGYIENKYELEEIRIDLRLLCKRAKVDFKAASADRLDPQKQEILTCSGERIQYDLISFDIGSLTANHKIPGLQESGTFIKPNFRVPQIKIAFETEERVVVVGGGASGIEMSLSLQARRNQLNVKIPVTLIHSGRLLESYGEQASRHITDIVHKKAVQLFQNDPVISVDGNHLMLKSGNCISFDRLLWLAGPSSPPIFQDSGLRTDAQGYLLVNDHLQSMSYPNIFGAGDCIGIQSRPNLHKAGVYAVREAPILWNNLQQFLHGQTLNRYRPQSDYLSILSTGNEEAMLLYRGLTFHGRWCWKLKRRIDTSFIRKYK
jgi:pyridine nucleotide-disulfide oxidoreductase family protein